MILSGLITYRQFWLGLARLPQRDGDKRQRLGGWHRLIAVWVAPFLLLVAITGFYFFVEGLGYGGGAAAGPLTEERSAPLPVGFDGAKIDAAVAVSLNIQSDLVPNSFAPARQQLAAFNCLRRSWRTFCAQGADYCDPSRNPCLSWPDPSGRKHWPGQIYKSAVGPALWYLGRRPQPVSLGRARSASATLAFVGASIFAARTAETTQVSGRGIARYWRGLGLLRWLYLIVLAGIIAMFFLRVVLG